MAVPNKAVMCTTNHQLSNSVLYHYSEAHHISMHWAARQWYSTTFGVFPKMLFIEGSFPTILCAPWGRRTWPHLSMHWAARQAVVRISLTWLCQFEASSLLSQRSILWDWSLQASTSLIRLSCRTLCLWEGEGAINIFTYWIHLHIYIYNINTLCHRSWGKEFFTSLWSCGYCGKLGLQAKASATNTIC